MILYGARVSQEAIALILDIGLTHPPQHSFAGTGFQSWFLFGKIEALVSGSTYDGSMSDQQQPFFMVDPTYLAQFVQAGLALSHSVPSEDSSGCHLMVYALDCCTAVLTDLPTTAMCTCHC